MLVGTGTPLTLRDGTPSTPVATEKAGFDLLDPVSVVANPLDPAVRGRFRDVEHPAAAARAARRRTFRREGSWAATSCAGTPSTSASGRRVPAARAVFDDDVLGTPSAPTSGSCEDSGYAVLRFSLSGGGEVTAEGDPGLPRTARAAGAGADAHRAAQLRGAGRFLARHAARDMCCTGAGRRPAGDGRRSRAAARHRCRAARAQQRRVGRASRPGCRPNPCADRSRRLADRDLAETDRRHLVDHSAVRAGRPGNGRRRPIRAPASSSRRARRIEQVSAQLVKDAQAGVASTACTQPCDNDPREPDKAQNSAAYLELTRADPGRGHRRRRAVPAGAALRRPPRGPRAGRRPGCGGAGALARRDRLPVGPAARGLLLRAGRPAQRVLGGGALPAASRCQLPAPLLRARVPRSRRQLRTVGLLTRADCSTKGVDDGKRRRRRVTSAGSGSTCYNGGDAPVRRRRAGPASPHDDGARARGDRAHPRRDPRVPARRVAAAGPRHPAAGRLCARVGARRGAGAGSERHGARSWRATPSCSAATPRRASRRSGRCSTSATSCA